ncbi:hypothetical protein GDO81_010060 [Engystomops pustulosus]|uniref:Uncharacterized protein n=1 Tax=Engystomops pustulosus TaxID=76066 RepID=A0AAV7BWU9_ENGPU|nr:hypothetical protein GDO81_010060 [Engystomops pustulosus]
MQWHSFCIPSTFYNAVDLQKNMMQQKKPFFYLHMQSSSIYISCCPFAHWSALESSHFRILFPNFDLTWFLLHAPFSHFIVSFR